MIFKPSSLHKFFFTYICPRFYGDAPKMPSQPTTTTQNVNTIPAELMPYYTKMLNSAQDLTQQEYKPYSNNSQDYVAPFSKLQTQAQQGAANLKVPGQFGQASQLAGVAGIGSMMAGQNYANQATDPNAVGKYMNPYLKQSLDPQLQLLNQQFGIQGAQQQGAATQAGAFGGSREALSSAMVNQNQTLGQQKMISEGYNQAFNQAQQAQQFGANLGLQGYGQGIQAAGQLGQLGQQQLAAQQGILSTQSQMGGQQQSQQQRMIDQAILNYQNAQQYPYMQLGFMSDLLHGTQTGNTTQTQYQAQPSTGSQMGGLLAGGLGAYMAAKAEGGVIEDKGYKDGGIVGYKDRGYVEESMLSKLEDLDKPRLEGIIQKNESPEMTGLAKEVYATKLATGGIVAFANKEEAVKEKKNPLAKRPDKMSGIKYNAKDVDKDPIVAKDELIAESPLVVADAAPITPEQAATLGPMSKEESLKNMALNQAEGFVPPVATSGIPIVQGPSAAKEPAPIDMQGILSSQKENVAAAEKEAARGIEERVKERSDIKEKLLGKDTETAEYRKSIMDEKANAPDEARRQLGMRLMQFGANWASTPGAPLIAGMKALKDTLPDVMEDTKESKNMMKDLDKSVYLLNHSERLDAEGRIDAAAKAREDASKLVMEHKQLLVTYGLKVAEVQEKSKQAELDRTNELEKARINASGTGSAGTYSANQQRQAIEAQVKDVNTYLANPLNDPVANKSNPEKLKEIQAYKNRQIQLYNNLQEITPGLHGIDYSSSTGGGESGLPSLNDINAELSKRSK
jgi:hypothetical protein